MEKVQLIEELFQKKLGIIIKNARLLRKRSVEECAAAIGINPAIYQKFETGESAPSLPQLEVLAYYHDIPIEHFFSSYLEGDRKVFEEGEDLQRFLTVRTKAIAARLKSYREEKGVPLAKMIANTTLSEEQYLAMEDGRLIIPMMNLQAFMYPLKCSLKEFLAEGGKIGNRYREEKAQTALENVPDELQKFLVNPSNEPYLRLAMHLSSLSAEKLRSIAEGLLEITF